MIEVVYGIPERSVTGAAFLDAMRAIAAEFDEHPRHMHAVLAEPIGGVRWVTVACSITQPGARLSEGSFVDLLHGLVPEFFVAARRYDETPERFEIHRGGRVELVLWRERDQIVASAPTPDRVPRTGDVDEMGLAVAGVPIVRPFDAFVEPTREIVLVDEYRRTSSCSVRELARPILPMRIEARFEPARGGVVFPYVRRAIDPTDFDALGRELARALRIAASGMPSTFEHSAPALARDVAALGPAITPLVEARLATPRLPPRHVRVCVDALALLGERPEVVFEVAKRRGAIAERARAALAEMGDVARPVLVSALASKKRVERDTAAVVLAMLDRAAA